jgi:hypothetical protein
MKIKQAYYYLFYKFYKLAEMTPSIFEKEYVAIVFMLWLEIFMFASLKLYYQAFVDVGAEISFGSFQVYFPLTVILLIKYFCFIRNARWKKYVQDFDKLSRDKNETGTFAVICVIVFVMVNLILAAHFRKVP